MRLEVPWGSDDVAVEVFGITLRFNQPLTSAIRAGAEVRVGRGLAVMGGNHALGRYRHEMLGAVQVIDRLFRVTHGPEVVASLVARVGAGRGIASSQQLVHAAVEPVTGVSRVASVTALARGQESRVPSILLRQPDLEENARIAGGLAQPLHATE